MTEAPDFPYLRFRLTVRPLRGPTASMPAAFRVRRAFGRELIRRFCPFGAPRCQDASPPGACPQLRACPYARVFARFATNHTPGTRPGHRSRPPFALATGRKGGGRAFVEVTLFAEAWSAFLWVIQSLEDALGNGIGGPVSRWRVEAVHRVHPDGRRARLILGPKAPTPDIVPDALPLGPRAGDADRQRDPRPVAIVLESPTRLVHERRVLGDDAPVPFAALVSRATDRIRDLYGDAATAHLARRIGNRDPAAVPLLADTTRFVEVRDWSSKKRTTLPLGGKLGTLVYGPGAAAFLPLFDAAAITHIGKNAASGLGRLRAHVVGCAVAQRSPPPPWLPSRAARRAGSRPCAAPASGP